MTLDLHSDVAQLGRVVDALRKADEDIPRETVKVMRDIAERIVELARTSVEAEPVHGLKHRGLRAAIADGTYKRDTADGAEVRAELFGWPGSNSESLPYDMDEGGWEHPLFGHDPWVSQSPYAPWFSGSVDAFTEIAEREVEDVLTKNIDEIEAA